MIFKKIFGWIPAVAVLLLAVIFLTIDLLNKKEILRETKPFVAEIISSPSVFLFAEQIENEKHMQVRGLSFAIVDNIMKVSFNVENVSDRYLAHIPSWGFMGQPLIMRDEFGNEYYGSCEKNEHGLELYPKQNEIVTINYNAPVSKARELWVEMPMNYEYSRERSKRLIFYINMRHEANVKIYNDYKTVEKTVCEELRGRDFQKAKSIFQANANDWMIQKEKDLKSLVKYQAFIKNKIETVAFGDSVEYRKIEEQIEIDLKEMTARNFQAEAALRIQSQEDEYKKKTADLEKYHKFILAEIIRASNEIYRVKSELPP